VAFAADPPSAAAKATAKKAYEQGTAFYKKGEWDQAIEQFELCYKSLPQPVFLFNIAQSHNKAGRQQQALTYYKRYLTDAPTAANRAEVETTVAELEQQLAPKPTVQLTALDTYPVETTGEPPPKGFVAQPAPAADLEKDVAHHRGCGGWSGAARYSDWPWCLFWDTRSHRHSL